MSSTEPSFTDGHCRIRRHGLFAHRPSRALGRRWPAATKDLADDLSRAGTEDAEAGTNEIGPDVSAIQNRRIRADRQKECTQ